MAKFTFKTLQSFIEKNRLYIANKIILNVFYIIFKFLLNFLAIWPVILALK